MISSEESDVIEILVRLGTAITALNAAMEVPIASNSALAESLRISQRYAANARSICVKKLRGKS